MIRITLSATLLLMACIFLQAQTITDALRYSTFEFGSTGRAIGAGSSFSALGADFSLISANPAGLASYRKGEFILTPGLFFEKTNASLQGAEEPSISETKSNFHLGNAGIVLASTPNSGHWKTVNFSIGLNRLANFNQKFYFAGASKGSIADKWQALAQGRSPEELDAFDSGLAYEAGALIPTDDPNYYETDFSQYRDLPVHKSQSYRSRGSANEFSLSLAGNYDDKLYAGLSVGFPFIFYDEDKVYSETDEEDYILAFNELSFNENLQAVGFGVNAKLGLIYRVNQMVRLGVAVHTPSLIGVEETYNNHLSYNYTDANNNGPIEAISPDGTFNYRITTPFRVLGSAGVVIGKHGFLSAEAEWVDYSAASFNFKTDDASDLNYERDLNNQISRALQSTLNLRAGGEWAYEIFRLRAGFGLMGNPFSGEGESTTLLSGGFGIREEKFFIDFAIRHSLFNEGYYPYRVEESGIFQFVENEIAANNYLLTLGFKF